MKPRKILKPRFPLETCAPNIKKVGPMKPFQGPTPVGQEETVPSSDPDAEGRVREALERHPLRDLVKESQTLPQP